MDFDNNEAGQEAYDHDKDSVGKACGIDINRDGGVRDAGEQVAERLFGKERGEKGVCTSMVVEEIEKQPGLNLREKILLSIMMGMSKGVYDAPHILRDILKRIQREKGEGDNGFGDGFF